MTEAGAAERLAALRSQRPGPEFRHAQAAKILTAGLSTSLVLGIVAYLGSSAIATAAAQEHAIDRRLTSEALALLLSRPVPTIPATTLPSTETTVQGTPTSAAPSAPQVVAVSVPRPATPPSGASGGGGAPPPANTTKPSG